jgi:hypothetical protein
MYYQICTIKYVLWNMYYQICTIKYLSNIIFPFHLRGETRPRMKMPGVARCWPLARALRNDVGAEHVQRMIRGLWLLGTEMILMWHIGFPVFDGFCNLRFEDEMDWIGQFAGWLLWRFPFHSKSSRIGTLLTRDPTKRPLSAACRILSALRTVSSPTSTSKDGSTLILYS